MIAEKELYDTFIFMYMENSCCLVTNEYTRWSKHILELTDKHNYPVIKIDSNVLYGDLIRDISELMDDRAVGAVLLKIN